MRRSNERLEDVGAGQLLVDRARGVEVPVVVVPEAAWLVSSTLWQVGLHAARGVGGRVVDSGTGRQQVLDPRLALALAESLHVVDAELGERRVERDPTLGHGDPDQSAEKALPHRMTAELPRRITPDRQDVTTIHRHHRRRTDAVGKAACRIQSGGGESGFLRPGVLSPTRPRRRRRFGDGTGGERSQPGEEKEKTDNTESTHHRKPPVATHHQREPRDGKRSGDRSSIPYAAAAARVSGGEHPRRLRALTSAMRSKSGPTLMTRVTPRPRAPSTPA